MENKIKLVYELRWYATYEDWKQYKGITLGYFSDLGLAKKAGENYITDKVKEYFYWTSEYGNYARYHDEQTNTDAMVWIDPHPLDIENF